MSNCISITPQHLDAIYKLNHTIFKDEIVYDRDFIGMICEKKQGFIAKIKDQFVGYVLYDQCYASELSELNKNVHTIISIGVLEKYRGMGIGYELMKLAIKQMQDWDIYLRVRISKPKLHDFYKKCGFTVQGVIKEYYDLIKDGTEDALLMKRKSLRATLKEAINKKKNNRKGH